MSWSSNSNSSTPCVSFIGIVDFSQEARWLYMTDSVTDLLGFEPKELIGRPSLELVHPDEFPRVRQLHYDTIQMDKAAVLVYLRLRHKDPYKGYILCGISRTVVHNVLVGSVSFASPGAKALQNASTAQEVTVISQGAANFEFRRWHDPSPLPPSPTLAPAKLPPSPSTESSSSSAWSSPSPTLPPLVGPNLSNTRNEPPPPQYRDEDFEPERSPSPITGRPRPRRLINKKNAANDGSYSIPGQIQLRSPPCSSPPPTASSSGYQRSPSPLYHDVQRRYLSTSPPPVGRSPSPFASPPRRSASPDILASPTADDYSPVHESHRRDRSYSHASAPDSANGNNVNGRHFDHGHYDHHLRRDEDQYYRDQRHRTPRHYRDSTDRRSGFDQDSPPSSKGVGHHEAQSRRDQQHNGYDATVTPRPSTSSASQSATSQPGPNTLITFDHLPNKSFRTAFILDRFSLNCTILYCSNDLLVESTQAIGRNFFDFVASKDEGIVRSWIECVKGWGVNERGQPSDGGFGFGRFTLLVKGRESVPRLPEPAPPSRHRQGSMTSRHGSSSRGSRHHGHDHAHREHYYSNGSRSITGHGSGPTSGSTAAYYQQRLAEHGEKFPVDAIFSAHSDGLMVILRRAQ